MFSGALGHLVDSRIELLRRLPIQARATTLRVDDHKCCATLLRFEDGSLERCQPLGRIDVANHNGIADLAHDSSSRTVVCRVRR